MANCMVFHTQIASIMEVLANAAVADICKLVDDDYAVFRLEMTQSQKENRALRRKLQLLELKVARDRVLASRPSSVKILDRNRGMARGHLTGGHRSFVKPAGHNTWRDDQPITVDEGSGTSTHHVIVIESVDAEDAGPGVKLERSEGEDPGQSTDIQTGAAGVLPVATEDPTPTRPRTRRSITEVSGTPNAVLKSETDTETLTVAHRLLHTGSGHRSDPERLGPLGCPPAPGTEYLPVFHQSQKTVNSCGNTDGDALDSGGDDLSCFYTTEMDSGNISLGLETQTDLSRGDWNQYSSSVYSEGCLDKKREVIAVDDVTVKVEGDTPLTWNADETHLGEGHSHDFLDYRESLETNPNVSSHSPVRTLRDRAPVSTSKGPSDSHCRVLFDQVLNSNDRARAQGGGNTSGSSKEKRFLCMFCNKGFSCLQKVEIHQRVHTGVKPFSCTQCDMRFAEAGSLKRHQRVHTGEKPYSCPQCHMRFTQAGSLKRHLKVHMGERLFV
ncbi:transcriptional regulator Kaiso-like [Oncorhynchus kisutch]|uniref:Transcriptional regulator Kaiso-like n=1 Tax=Oncorhynchus kisutch TaxID=8019 RepID=A0A8C7GT45_ONCKI|nr:transcriptional regulator Kaiso-like [Oncorhynchus kisutch]